MKNSASQPIRPSKNVATQTKKQCSGVRRNSSLTLFSPAKINLTLDVLGVNQPADGGAPAAASDTATTPAPARGYHFVDTVMQEIGLADKLTFTLLDRDEIIIKSDCPSLPNGEKSTVFKAIKLLEPLRKAAIAKTKQQSPPGIKIEIKKRIPLSSGLGGGSSNAAATLNALNRLWNLNLSPARLRLLAAKIGMDAPFFIEGGTARCARYGDKVRPLPPAGLPPHLIVMDDEKSSTKDMYAALDAAAPTAVASTAVTSHPYPRPPVLFSSAIHPLALSSLPLSKMLSKRQHLSYTFSINTPASFRNAFDSLQSQKTRSLQKKLLQLGAIVVHTCGSGPALYALFPSELIKRKAYKELKGHVRFIWRSQNKK